jgi:hypothetical protein
MGDLLKEAFDKVSREDKEKELDQIVKEVIPIIHEMKTEKSEIGVLTGKDFTEVDKYGTKVLCLTGGLNGCGEWEDYFSDLSKVVTRLKKEGYHTWTINLENDCLDDVFYLKLGISRKKNDDE